MSVEELDGVRRGFARMNKALRERNWRTTQTSSFSRIPMQRLHTDAVYYSHHPPLHLSGAPGCCGFPISLMISSDF